jgi:hypothetical protein
MEPHSQPYHSAASRYSTKDFVMTIIFYDANNERLYICTETDKTRVISTKDPSLMDFIPNDNILYVENGHFITKEQFSQWLNGDFELNSSSQEDTDEVSRFAGFLNQDQSVRTDAVQTEQSPSQRLYVHSTSNGTIRIEDIEQFPEGIQLNGKWHFLPVDEIGEDILMRSSHFQILLAKGKAEIVNESYVRANKHKQRGTKSPAQSALDAILVPANIKAEAAAGGGWQAQDIAEEIWIEG